MRTGRLAAVVLVGVVLTLTLAVGNVVFAAHASILDPGFVTESIEEEDGYDALTQEMRRAVENATGNATGGANGSAFASLVDGNPVQEAVTPAYVESQLRSNVEAFYAYLHGNSERLNLTLDTGPLATDAGETVAESIRNATVTELVEAAPGDPFEDVPVDAAFVEQLNEGPDAYADAKDSLWQDLRETAIDRRVDQEFRNASNDELLALVIPDYDPREYSEAEKERMVDDREGEIRTAIRERIEAESDGEIDEAVEDRLVEMRAAAAEDQPSADEVGNEAIANAAGELQMAVVTASTTDQSYEEYRADVTRARENLSVAMGDYVTDQVNEEAGVVDLNEQMEIPPEGAFEGPRTVVGYLDLSAIVLPLLALVLVGGIWLLTHSVVTTAATLGVSLLVATVPAIVGGSIAGERLRSMIELEGEGAATLEPVVAGVVDRIVETLTGQSLLLAFVGLVLLGVALALYYDVDERISEARANR